MLVFSLVGPGDEFEYEDPIEYVHEELAFDTVENIAGMMIITPISLLSLLASCSFYRYAALPTTCYQASHISMSSL